MFSINLQRPLVTLAVMAGLLSVAGPASASSTDLNAGGIATDNNDPDEVWADHAGNASNATGAVVAADFNYSERATALTAPLGSTKRAFIEGHSAAVESGYETKTRPHADGAVLGFFDIPAELKSLRSSVERP